MSIQVLLAYFQKKHREHLGVPCFITYGKDNKILKDIITLYGLDMSCKLVDKFYEKLSSDVFLQQTGVSVGIFKSQIPKLILDTQHDNKQEHKGKWN